MTEILTSMMRAPKRMSQAEIDAVRARIAEEDRQSYRRLQENKKKLINERSLFSGDQRISFEFSQWQPDKQPNSQLARELGVKAWELTKQLKTDNFNVLMTGGAGTGKTSLSIAMATELFKTAGKSWLFISTMELNSLFERRFDELDVRTKLDQLQKAITGIKDGTGGWYMPPVDVLILDDFGTEGGMRTDKNRVVRKDMQEWLYRASNARVDLNANKLLGTTIVTTNNTGKELAEMYNEKLVSRLFPKSDDCVLNFAGLTDVRFK